MGSGINAPPVRLLRQFTVGSLELCGGNSHREAVSALQSALRRLAGSSPASVVEGAQRIGGVGMWVFAGLVVLLAAVLALPYLMTLKYRSTCIMCGYWMTHHRPLDVCRRCGGPTHVMRV